MARHAQSLNSSLHARPQNLQAFLDHAETGEKGQNVISSSAQHPISLNFCNPCFFYHTFTSDVDFIDKAYAEICDHSLLPRYLVESSSEDILVGV